MSKKTNFRVTGMRPIRISGEDASILSYVAKHGAPSSEERNELKKHLSSHVRSVAFGSSKRSAKKGRETLDHLRRVAKDNALTLNRELGSNAGRFGLSVRDNGGEIRSKRGDTRVRVLRDTYGADFAAGYRSDTRLETVLEREGFDSLKDYLRSKAV